MNILCIGDIVGKPGRQAVEKLLGDLKREYKIDFTIVNAENAAAGAGLTSRIAKSLLQKGCDVITLGDHAWDQKELEPFLAETNRVIRPANFPPEAPGLGWTIQETASGVKVGVVNLLGRVFMRYQVECPFRKLQAIAAEIVKQTPIIVVDMHAETTSEKMAMGQFADGLVSAVVGTHTHIQTADEKVLSKGTAYLTDMGMTGPYDSVIGQDKQAIIRRFLTSLPIRFHVAKDDVWLMGAIIEVDEKTGRAKSIVRLQRSFQYNPLADLDTEN